MQDKNYRQLGGVLQHVLDTIQMAHELGLWVEVVTLVVPGFNDSPDELWEAARFLASVSTGYPLARDRLPPRLQDGRPAHRGRQPAPGGRDRAGSRAALSSTPATCPGGWAITKTPSARSAANVLVEAARICRPGVPPDRRGACPHCGTSIPASGRRIPPRCACPAPATRCAFACRQAIIGEGKMIAAEHLIARFHRAASREVVGQRLCRRHPVPGLAGGHRPGLADRPLAASHLSRRYGGHSEAPGSPSPVGDFC